MPERSNNQPPLPDSRTAITTGLAPVSPEFGPADEALFREAWNIARDRHGKEITFYLPGMIRFHGFRGRYPALSITGNRCELQCLHCAGTLLQPMLKVDEPEELLRRGRLLAANGNHGILLTGGSDRNGELPWKRYLDVISSLGRETTLHLSAHTGFPDLRTAKALKAAGIRQALLDVMGDEKAATEVYRLPGLHKVLEAIEAVKTSDIAWIPHIVAGLYFGRIDSEYRALEIIRRYHPTALVIVVLSPLKGTAMSTVKPPAPLAIARLIASARLLMPDVPIALGCERPRNREGTSLECLALRAGITRMAVWSEEAVEEALALGLRPRFQATCCSVDYRTAFSSPDPHPSISVGRNPAHTTS